MSFHLVAALAALLLAAAVLAVPNNTVAMGPVQQPMIGLPAPPISLKTTDGRQVAISELHGKIVVVHFAASWWPFCNAEAPHLEALYKKYQDRGVQVLIVDVKESEETAGKWAQSKKFTFPVLLDLDGKTAERYAPAGVLPDLPRDQVAIASNLIIDQNGRIQFFSLLDSANFDARLVQLTTRLEELLAGAQTTKEVVSAPTRKEVVSIIPPVLVTVLPGGRAQARIAVLIAGGFHIQANPASDPYLIPTKIDLQASRGVFAEAPKYPPGKPYRLAGSSQDLSTYEGTIELSVPLRAAEDAVPGDWIVRGKLRYQACDSRSCLPPASLDVSVPVHVPAVKKKLPLFK